MNCKADILLEQGQRYWKLGDVFVVAAFMPVLHGNYLEPQALQEWLWKVDRHQPPGAQGLVPKQVRMEEAKSEIRAVALDLKR